MLFIQTSHKKANRPQLQSPEYLNLVVREGVSQNTGYAFFCERDFPRIPEQNELILVQSMTGGAL